MRNRKNERTTTLKNYNRKRRHFQYRISKNYHIYHFVQLNISCPIIFRIFYSIIKFVRASNASIIRRPHKNRYGIHKHNKKDTQFHHNIFTIKPHSKTQKFLGQLPRENFNPINYELPPTGAGI